MTENVDPHPPLEDLVDRGSEPDLQRHLARCPECRIAVRLFAEASAADPAVLPEVDEARDRLDAAQREASQSLSRSLGGTEDDLGDGALKPGQVVERYTVEALIGKGGMGAVYRVRHNRLGSAHALKVLQYASRSVRSRLIREGRAQSGLRHPNIVAVTDVVEVDGAPGLIMELVDGPSLGEWLRQNGRPSIWEADALAEGIIRGLAAAHKAQLVHRDLKPANILLAKSEAGLVPKIADFGLARFLEPHATDTHLTRADAPMGTPSFMAPEQISDASRADARSDLFSLGAVLYELVTARRAFEGTNVVEIYNRVHEGRYTPLRELVPDLPDRMARTIERALRVDPALRFEDCRALLASWSGVEVVDSSAPATRERRPWTSWLAAAGLLAVAVAGGAGTVWVVGKERSQAPNEQPAAGSERRLTNQDYYHQIRSFSLSPDGRSLAWCEGSGKGSGMDLVHLSLEGGSPAVLLADDLNGCVADFFSESQRILWMSQRPVGTIDGNTPWAHIPWSLWAVGLDGSIEPIPEGTNVGTEWTAYAELSPDDRRLAQSGKAGPWVYSLDTLSGTRLRPLDAADVTRAIEWSPSGEYLAAIHSNSEQAWLEITAADGSSSRRVLTDPRLGTVTPMTEQWDPSPWGANLAWLEPDRLVYGLVDDRVSPIETTLYVVDDASTATDFADAAVFERFVGGYIMDLAATPDGRRLAYRREEAQADLWVLPLDDPESAMQLTQNDWDELPCGWTATGDLVWASDHKGHADLYTVRPEDFEAKAPPIFSADPAREWPGDAHGDVLLWWRAESDGNGAETGQVLVRAVPGAEQVVPVLRLGQGDYTVRCPLAADRRCLVAERAARSTEFRWLDEAKGELGPVLQPLSTGPGVTGWDLSPDGNRLAVVRDVPSELVIRDVLDGGVVTHRLDGVRPRELAWAPSGDALYLSGISLDPQRGHRISQIWSVGLDGTLQPVWSLPLRLMSDPTPSPDGKWLAVRITDFQSADLWLLDRPAQSEK